MLILKLFSLNLEILFTRCLVLPTNSQKTSDDRLCQFPPPFSPTQHRRLFPSSDQSTPTLTRFNFFTSLTISSKNA
jgi:hypothetical protein